MLNIRTKLLIWAATLISIILIINFIIATPAIFPVAKNNDWIGFYGAICGGIATIIAVYATINYNRKRDEIDYRLKHKPYFKLEIISETGLDRLENLKKIHLNVNGEQEKINIIPGYLKVTNLGLGTAVNMKVDGDKNRLNNCTTYGVGETSLYLLELNCGDKNSTNITGIVLYYDDLLGNQYKQVYHVEINQKSDKISILNSMEQSLVSKSHNTPIT